MTDHTPPPARETLEELLERVTFENPDPRIQRLKQIWADARAEAALLFQTADDETLAACREHHAICQTPDAEQVAQAETALLRQKLIEEREQRLMAIWTDICRRVNAVLEELKGA